MGFVVTPDDITRAAKDVREASIMSRTGGAKTLAVGMAQILSSFLGGRSPMGIWYHFAILFILTTVEAGTRVLQFMIQDSHRQRCSGFQRDCDLDQPRRFGAFVRAMGLLSLTRRDRSIGWNLDALASVRDRQSDAGRNRVDGVHRRTIQDETRAVCVGDHCTRRLAHIVHGEVTIDDAPPRGRELLAVAAFAAFEVDKFCDLLVSRDGSRDSAARSVLDYASA